MTNRLVALKPKDFYEDVLKGDFKKINERSPMFYEFILKCAREESRQDVVHAIIEEYYTQKPSVDWLAVGVATLVFGVVFIGVARITCG